MQAEERVRGPAKAASAVLAAVAAAQFALTGTWSGAFCYVFRRHASIIALITRLGNSAINRSINMTTAAGAALAVDPPILQGQKDVPQIFSPKDAQDIQEGRVSKAQQAPLLLQTQLLQTQLLQTSSPFTYHHSILCAGPKAQPKVCRASKAICWSNSS